MRRFNGIAFAIINGDDHGLFLPKVILYLHYSSVV